GRLGLGPGGAGCHGTESASSSSGVLAFAFPNSGGGGGGGEGGAETEGEPSEAQLLDEIESHFGAGSDLWQSWSAAPGGPCEGEQVLPREAEAGRKRLAPPSEALLVNDDRARRRVKV
ncbi:unnamed protein product, partial [Laminaria digitata]